MKKRIKWLVEGGNKAKNITEEIKKKEGRKRNKCEKI